MLLPILKWYEFNCQRDFDVFNALDLMENKEFLEKLKFGIGDGNLQYYLYNWKCPFMEPEKVSYLAPTKKKNICRYLSRKIWSVCFVFF